MADINSIGNRTSELTIYNQTNGVLTTNGSGVVSADDGTSGYVLTANGAGVTPTFQPVSNGTVKVTSFTMNGTWTKDADAKFVRAFIYGGGSGGGSGRRGASTNAGGASGGAGGGFLQLYAPADFFGATEAVVVGAGGTGGAAQTVNDTNGNDGGIGAISSFGDFDSNRQTTAGSDPNGRGGVNGTITNVNTTQPMILNLVDTIVGTITGQSRNPTAGAGTLTIGSSGTSINLGTPTIFTSLTIISGAGGGGSGADSVTERQSGNGSTIAFVDYTGAVLYTFATGGTGGLESATINGTDGSSGVQSTEYSYYYTMGAGGGGGGGQSVGAAAGNGGNGGFPGGGGGGGGGSLNGTDSGAGGDGADGLVVVLEYL